MLLFVTRFVCFVCFFFRSVAIKIRFCGLIFVLWDDQLAIAQSNFLKSSDDGVLNTE